MAGEIAVLPLVFGAWEIAALFSLANLVLLRHRIRVEDQALARCAASDRTARCAARRRPSVARQEESP